jgi:hypothetical protein
VFPKGFSLSVNPKHYSNEEETKKIIHDIILPHVNSVRNELKLSADFPALLVMDVFRGQMTQAVHSLLEEHNIIISLVPNNMTHIFQPLDLTVDSWAKKFMKEKYAVWYSSQIKAGLEKGIAIDEIDVKTQLTVVKPLHAKWLIEMYNEVTTEKGKEIIINGWRAAGILDAVKMGSVDLQCLDPFHDVDPVSGRLTAFSQINLQFPGAGDDNVNERYENESDSEDEYFLDEEANAFDLFTDA